MSMGIGIGIGGGGVPTTVPGNITFSGNVAIQGTLDVTGVATFTTTVTGSGNIMAGAAFALGFTGRGQFKSSADALLEAYATDGATRGSVRTALGTLSVNGIQVGAANNGLYVDGSGFMYGVAAGAAGWMTTASTVFINTGGLALGAGVTLGDVVVKNITSGLARFTTGDIGTSKSLLTAGTMTATAAAQAVLRRTVSKFTWTNAQVTALGAVTAGDIKVCTLPAKFVVTNVLMVVDTAETALTSLTGAVGRVSATYLDYVVASSLKAAANTVYGDADAERGTNMSPTKAIDLPSYTGTTDVFLHLVSGVENLSTALACTGTVLVEGYLLP